LSENKYTYVFNSDYIIEKYQLANLLCAFGDIGYQTGSLVVPIDAVRFLSHFLDNTGSDYTMNVNSLLSTSINAVNYYNEHMSYIIEYAKDIVKDGQTITIATNCRYTAHDKKLAIIDMNWTGALGSCSGAIVAKVTRNNNRYKITYKYYIYDYYDWNEMLDAGFVLSNLWDSDLAKLHRAGIAREFYVIGNIENKMEILY